MLIGDLIEMEFLGNAYNPNLGAAVLDGADAHYISKYGAHRPVPQF